MCAGASCEWPRPTATAPRWVGGAGRREGRPGGASCARGGRCTSGCQDVRSCSPRTCLAGSTHVRVCAHGRDEPHTPGAHALMTDCPDCRVRVHARAHTHRTGRARWPSTRPCGTGAYVRACAGWGCGCGCCSLRLGCGCVVDGGRGRTRSAPACGWLGQEEWSTPYRHAGRSHTCSAASPLHPPPQTPTGSS